MNLRTTIRSEIGSAWERRTPLTPDGVRVLLAKGLNIQVQSSKTRIFPDADFLAAGATIVQNTEEAELVLGIAGPQPEEIHEQQIHVAFSCTIKGQPRSMPMLQKFLDRKATLIDYELFKDENGRKALSFGRFAGIAGTVNTFWIAGQKLAKQGTATPLHKLQQTYHYGNVDKTKQAITALAPLEYPLRVIITGTGNVSQGSREVCQWLGLPEVRAEQVLSATPPPGPWFSVLDISETVEEKTSGTFDLVQYLAEGKNRYRGTLEKYLGKFDILLQGAYWDVRFPKLLSRETLVTHRASLPWVIGDISCDIDGSLECTFRASNMEQPVFTYLPESHTAEDGISWDGPTVLALETLPCELSEDASDHFSRALLPLLSQVSKTNLNKPLHESGLPAMLQRATIVYNGELTPKFSYLGEFLRS